MVRLKGYPERTETFDTKKEAEDWAKDVESGLKHGRLGIGAPDRTFAELLDRFEEKKLEEMPRVDHGYRGQRGMAASRSMLRITLPETTATLQWKPQVKAPV